MTEKLLYMPYAQAEIKREQDKVCLISYVTKVIEIDTTSGWVQCYGTFSRTTAKHISAFCRQMGCGDYYTMKLIYKDNMRYNMWTGEIEGIV
jgi:hypothetical protein